MFIYPLCAQQPNHNNFIHIGVNEGLSQNTVFDIDQDKQGHMWFATHDGLNKYDGYNFTIYRHDEQNPNSIGSDVIRACIVDTQGRVWAGTEKGLSLYDASQDQFHNFTYSKDNKDLAVYDIVEIDAKQLLLFQTKEKVCLYSIQKHRRSPTNRYILHLRKSNRVLSTDKEIVFISEVTKAFISIQFLKTLWKTYHPTN